MAWKRFSPRVTLRLFSTTRQKPRVNSMLIKSDYPSVQIPRTSFPEIVVSAIRKHKDKTAFVCAETDKEVSYRKIYKTAYSLATFLRKKGFHKQVACAALPNQWEWSPIFLGVTLNGGVLTTVSTVSTEHELKRQFIDSGAKLVFTNPQSLAKVQNAAQGSHVNLIICVGNADSPTPFSNCYQWEDVVQTEPRWNLESPSIDVDHDPIFMPYSSGTTGTPKGVMLTHSNYNAMMNIYNTHEALRITGALNPPWNEEKDKKLLMLPFYHCYGFALLMSAMLHGNTTIVMSHFHPELFCKTIERYRIRFVAVVPPILVFLAKSPICQKYDLSSLQVLFSGAAPAGKDLCEELVRKYKNLQHIQQGYGMSELSMASHMPDLIEGQPFGSVGKVVSNLEMKIVDPETNSEKHRGEIGEVCIRGPTVMRGYLGKPDATSDCIKDGWMHTGDIGYVDENGYLFIVDRLKELIKVKGFQVPPAELEDMLLRHPMVHDVAVIGVPDAQSGELPKAFIVRSSNELTEEQVKAYVQERVSPYKQLAEVEFVKEIPKSPAGKILRRVLREKETSKT